MTKTKKALTQEEVREQLDYDPETGELRWKDWKKGRKMGRAVGTRRRDGYLVININGKLYATHRVIWLWWHGYFPENEIDHIDRDKLNNRLSNLREVSRTCNSRNCGVSSNNKSGVTGIHWDVRCEKWFSVIMVAHKHKFLGLHTEFTEAVAHRLAAEQCLDWAGCDSNSSAYQYMKRVGVI